MRFATGVALAVAISTAARTARAATFCAPLAGSASTLAGFTADERLGVIEAGLRRGARRARIWAWSWAGLYSAITVGQLASLAVRGSESQKDVAVGAPGALLGVAALALAPLKVMGDQRRLDQLLLAAGPASDRCALLAEAERLLVRDAASEAFGRSPLVHIGNVVVNLGLGLALGLGFGHWTPAAITFAVGVTVGELQIFTQPTDVSQLLANYRAGLLEIDRAPSGEHWTIAPSIAPGYYALAFNIHF